VRLRCALMRAHQLGSKWLTWAARLQAAGQGAPRRYESTRRRATVPKSVETHRIHTFAGMHEAAPGFSSRRRFVLSSGLAPTPRRSPRQGICLAAEGFSATDTWVVLSRSSMRITTICRGPSDTARVRAVLSVPMR